MHRKTEAEVTFLSPGKSQCRGMVVQVTPILSSSPDTFGSRALIKFSEKWQTTVRVDLKTERLHLVTVGHLYARKADTFDSSDSLRILGSTYRNKGVDAVRAEIGGGMFVLFIVDLEKQLLHVMCDLFACMPLFYDSTSDSVTFATNQLDLHENRKLLNKSCLEYLNFGYLPFSPSLFEGINRLGPGQTVTVDLTTGCIAQITDEQLPVYLPLTERIQDPNVAVQELDCALTRFFSRFNGESIAAGLSGGYDSRLIAAFTSKFSPYLVTFNYPGTREADFAQQVAGMLGSETHIFDIPADAPSRFIEDFTYGMQTLDNLGSSHVFALLDALLQGNPSYIIDGFLGDTIIGGGYYYKLYGGGESAAKVLTLTDHYKGRIRSIDTYVNMCLSGYGRTIELPIFTKNNEAYISTIQLKSFVTQQLACCHSHADMVEMLLYRFRGRCLIACGPITFLRRRNTLCPFYDTDVLRTCLSVDKRIRAGEKLYNAFWRHRFPKMADIPKESSGGRATQTDFWYRMKHFSKSLQRRAGQRWPAFKKFKSKAGGDINDFTTRYCRHKNNNDYFNKAIKRARLKLLDAGLEDFMELMSHPSLSEKYYLRWASLAVLLEQTK